MKRFNYADEKISGIELMIAIPSVLIGVGILTLPKSLAQDTIAGDGWIFIVAGGILTMLIAWCIAKIATLFPGKPFVEFTSMVATKPVAIVLTLVFTVTGLLVSSYQVRSIADIAQKYLFDRTPPEIIALTFLLVVVYAVSGTRVGILRLNMLFFPIILFITLVVLAFSVGSIEVGHFQPMFQTSVNGYWSGLKAGIESYSGLAILWFYSMLLRKPEKAPKMALIGTAIPMLIYLLLFIVTIGVFGNSVTANLVYPTVELAKSVEIPGEFFERFESLFFTIWIMAIFNTTAVMMDIMVFSFTSVFKKVPKQRVLFIAAPILFFIAMLPKNVVTFNKYVTILVEFTVINNLFLIVLLFSLSKIRGAKIK